MSRQFIIHDLNKAHSIPFAIAHKQWAPPTISNMLNDHQQSVREYPRKQGSLRNGLNGLRTRKQHCFISPSMNGYFYTWLLMVISRSEETRFISPTQLVIWVVWRSWLRVVPHHRRAGAEDARPGPRFWLRGIHRGGSESLIYNWLVVLLRSMAFCCL